MSVTFYTEDEYRALERELDCVKADLSSNEQITRSALTQVWKKLGVTNQTQCMLRLAELLAK